MTKRISLETGIKYIVFGEITRDFIIPYFGDPVNNIPGGNALYTAVGAAIWDTGIGLVSYVGENFPIKELKPLSSHGIDLDCISIIPEDLDQRKFFSPSKTYDNNGKIPRKNHFQRHQNLSSDMLGNEVKMGGHRESNFRFFNHLHLPEKYQSASFAHLCSLDYSSSSSLISMIKKMNIHYTSISPSSDLMAKNQFSKMTSIIHDMTICFVDESQLRNLFLDYKSDLWELIDDLATYGKQVVICKSGISGQLVYDAISKKRWHIPAYPAKLINPTRTMDAFCGGFMAGYRQRYDPLEASLCGNVSESMVADGIGIFHPLDRLQGLEKARLEKTKSLVRVI